MNQDFFALRAKPTRLVIGLMTGTSADGIDAVLTEITGYGLQTKVKQRDFLFVPYQPAVRDCILQTAEGINGGSALICRLSTLLGRLYADACLALCEKSGITPDAIDLVGNHGQTVWHMPETETFLGYPVRGTLQIGEDAIIAQVLGCPVIGDFRVRDMAAGGLGAPLVPYTEYLLYRDEGFHVALQNIGGIGNVTILPKDCLPDQVIAFDTGPGNMVIDALTAIYTEGKASYDEGGQLAAKGIVRRELLAFLLDDPYLSKRPPKTTGREYYGADYVKRLLEFARTHGISIIDTISTATRFTAECIAVGLNQFAPVSPDYLIIGGGGSHNHTLLADIQSCLPECKVQTNENLGYDSDSKEAVAFAILANEALFGMAGNVPSVTGAEKAVVMGKISQ